MHRPLAYRLLGKSRGNPYEPANCLRKNACAYRSDYGLVPGNLARKSLNVVTADTEDPLYSAVLQTSNSILLLRRRAEDELLLAKQALEARTEELAATVALMRATLESTTDGILVTDGQGGVTDFNQRYLEMWRIPQSVIERTSDKEVRQLVSEQLKDPAGFLARVAEIYRTSPDDTNDLLSFLDGRIFERHSRVQRVDDRIVGRVWSFRDITEQSQSYLVARRLAAIVDSSYDAIVSKDLNLIVTSWNAGAERIFGYTASEMIGTSIMKIVPPDRYAEEEMIRERISRGERVDPMETVRLAKDGRLIDLSVTISPLKDSSGRVVGASKVARDITERKRSERARQISEARNAAVLQSALDCIVMINHDSVVLEWNPAAERTFGYTREQALGQPMHELIVPPDYRARHLAGIARYMSTGQTVVLNRRIEVPAIHVDGHEMLVELAITAIPVEGPPVFTAYLRDLTEQRRNERALAESHSLLRAVIESTEDAVFVKDLDGRYQMINPAGARMLGALPEKIIGSRDDELLPAHSAASSIAHDREILASKTSQTYEDTTDFHGDQRTFLSTKSPYRDADGNVIGVVGISRDITDRKRNEEALEAAKNDAENANRAKSEFLSRMSHELRTPLNAIIGFSQLLELGELPPSHRERVGYIHRAGRHLLELINEVLDISRIEAGRLELSLEPVNVMDVLHEAADLVRPLASERGVRVIFPTDDGANVHVCADRQRLKQVLLNLLANAVKYNRERGSVTLSSTQMPDKRVRIGVADSGLGISKESLKRLFVPFERLGAEHTAVQGTGLGLALSKRFVEVMGGALGCESEVGAGSQFWIELPRATTATQHAKDSDAEPPLELQTESDTTVLYIEDNASNLTLIEHLVQTQPRLKLISAVEGKQGLELARLHQPDLILLDVHLPDMDGAEVLRRLRADASTRDIPVIVLSADATARQIQRLRDAGACDYLTKPLNLQRFFQVIESQTRDRAKLTASL